MNKFKLTPKIALITVLALITIAGILLYLRYNNTAKKNPAALDSGFLSFFGGRKVKPSDEGNIPGVIPNQGGATGGLSSGLTSGETTSGDTAGGTAGNNTAGRLTLKPIGSSGLSTAGTTTGNTGGGSTTVGGTGSTSGNTGGGSTTVGGTGGTSGGTTTGGNVIPQIDCTPPSLPYTQEQIAELRELTQRFYRISANLHTNSDIQNENDTRKAYYDLYNQTIDYTKQCYAELKDPKYADKAKNSSAAWHPYLTDLVLEKIKTYDPRVAFVTTNAKTAINKRISQLADCVYGSQTQINFIDNLSTKTNIHANKKKQLQTQMATCQKEWEVKAEELKNLGSTGSSIAREIIGTFFTEDVYKDDKLFVARRNNNARIDYIWGHTKHIIDDNGRGSNVVDNFWTGSHDYFNINPLKSLVLDKWDESLNDAPRYQPGNFPQSYMHKFRMLEDGLRVW